MLSTKKHPFFKPPLREIAKSAVGVKSFETALI